MRYQFVFVILLSLTFSAVSFAKIGTKKEVLEAARANEEPAYITRLMQALSVKLNQFVDARGGLKSPREKAAFLMMMRIFNDIAVNGADSGLTLAKKYRTVLKADSEESPWALAKACNASNMLKWGVYCCSMGKKCSNNRDFYNRIRNTPIWIATQKRVYNFASRAAKSALREQVFIAALAQRKVVASEGIRIATRVAEWTGLNYLLKHADEILPAIYGVLEAHLPHDSSNWWITYGIFDNPESWRLFQSEKFGQLSTQAMAFLNPWLDVLGKNTNTYSYFVINDFDKT